MCLRVLASRGRRRISAAGDPRQCRSLLRPGSPACGCERDLSAGNSTNLSDLHQPAVSGLIPTQDGAPAFPNILPARILTTTLVDFTTMDPHVQNAYSKQASVAIERVLGGGRTVEWAIRT